MSGKPVASATGGRDFIPRISKRRRSLEQRYLLPAPESTAQPTTPTTSQSNQQQSPTTVLAISPPVTVPPVTHSTLSKVNGHASPQIHLVPDWRKLPERELWRYFAKIRALYYHQQPAVTSALGSRYFAIREFLYHLCLPDVLRRVALFKRRRLPANSLVEAEDLHTVASRRTLRGIDTYDPDYGDGQMTFMKFMNACGKSGIDGSMVDELRRLQHLPRYVSPIRKDIKTRMIQLQNKLNHKPTLEEFCDEYGWHWADSFRADGWLLFSNVFNQSHVISENDSDDDEGDWEDSVIKLCESRPQALDRNILKQEKMGEVLAAIPDPDIRYIIFSYMYTGSTNKQVARELTRARGRYFSQSWVAAKHKEGLQILRDFYQTRDEMRVALIQ